MKYAQIRKMDISNGEGIGISLFTQGCPFHCKDCFNPETWDFDGGIEYTKETEETIINLMKPDYIKRISILGGEPLIERNIKSLKELFLKIRKIYPSKKIWVYTGNLFEDILNKYPDLLKLIDILVDGPFQTRNKDFKLKWRGSSNQRIIDVQKTLKENKIILMEV